MKLYKFTVVFTNHNEQFTIHNEQTVMASHKEAAIILAQAKQIEAGLSYVVEKLGNAQAVFKEGELV